MTEYRDLKIFLVFSLIAILLRNLFMTRDLNGKNMFEKIFGFSAIKNKGYLTNFCDEKSLIEILKKIEMTNPNYIPNDNQTSEKYQPYKLSYINSFIINTLNKASGGCFKNIGFDKIRLNGGTWDTIINLYEQKKYFGVMLRAVVKEEQDGKMSMVYIGLLSPMPVGARFSPSSPPPTQVNTGIEYVELETSGHYKGTYDVIHSNEEYEHVKMNDSKPYIS
tara:strand:+ start:4074 stop:4736 length:663 start_codon:yes stop_codon:yes gene_type:complete